jgi:hypothetical protein
MIDKILFAIGIFIFSWLFLYNFFYSPKARIKSLWKRILEIAEIEEKIKSNDLLLNLPFTHLRKKPGSHINSIIECELDEEKDVDFIEENKYRKN